MRTVREHLKPDGAFSMYNYYRSDVFERYATTLTQVFGHAPCIDRGLLGATSRSQSVLTIGLRADTITCGTPWVQSGVAPEPATDDHPFPYLRGRTIPSSYLIALRTRAPRVARHRPCRIRPAHAGDAPYADLFFMGAAFLLLETKNVVQFALLFGTTWFVNSLVFAGILLAVLGAVEIARRSRLPDRRVLYGLLAASLVVAWALRPDRPLLGLEPAVRFAAAAALAFAPVFLANLIFSQRFRDVGTSTVAFGANLLGAMLGGVLEYGAIIVGYRDLLVLVTVLYGSAFLLGRRHLRMRPAADLAALETNRGSRHGLVDLAVERIGPRSQSGRLAVEGLAGGDRYVDLGSVDRERMDHGVLVLDRDRGRGLRREAIRRELQILDRDHEGSSREIVALSPCILPRAAWFVAAKSNLRRTSAVVPASARRPVKR